MHLIDVPSVTLNRSKRIGWKSSVNFAMHYSAWNYRHFLLQLERISFQKFWCYKRETACHHAPMKATSSIIDHPSSSSSAHTPVSSLFLSLATSSSLPIASVASKSWKLGNSCALKNMNRCCREWGWWMMSQMNFHLIKTEKFWMSSRIWWIWFQKFLWNLKEYYFTTYLQY